MPNDGLNEAYFSRGFQALEDELGEVTNTLAAALPPVSYTHLTLPTTPYV